MKGSGSPQQPAPKSLDGNIITRTDLLTISDSNPSHQLAPTPRDDNDNVTHPSLMTVSAPSAQSQTGPVFAWTPPTTSDPNAQQQPMTVTPWTLLQRLEHNVFAHPPPNANDTWFSNRLAGIVDIFTDADRTGSALESHLRPGLLAYIHYEISEAAETYVVRTAMERGTLVAIARAEAEKMCTQSE